LGDIAYTGGIFDISDRRLKENIREIDDPIGKVQQLRGIYFDMKDRSLSEGTEIGVIAQEIELVLPEVVSEDNAGYKAVDYSKFTALLIETVKELKAEIDEKEAQITELSERLEALERE